MASNFKILVHKNSESLHLKLLGDFDGSSAHELLNTLSKNAAGVRRVFVHTSGLKQIHSFGREVFLNRLGSLTESVSRIIFTGEAAGRIAPNRIFNDTERIRIHGFQESLE